MADRIDEFVALIRRVPGVEATVDRPDDAKGESFIDITGPGLDTQVSYRPSVGFGLFGASDGFGQRPDVLIADPAEAIELVLAGNRQVRSGSQYDDRHKQKISESISGALKGNGVRDKL